MDIKAGEYYRPNSPEMAKIAKEQTLAAWRHQNKGPDYIKAGSNVLYQGQDILDWLDKQRVKPVAA